MILFVCTGNTCRSPLAAALARAYGVDAQSAGLDADPGDTAPPEAVRAAGRHGGDLRGHQARNVQPFLIREADRVYAMTRDHERTLRMRFPEYSGKIHVLNPSIPDPYGGNDADYEECVRKLLAAMRGAGIIPGPVCGENGSDERALRTRIELRKINEQDAAAQWEYTTALPADENGLTNPYCGVSFDEYLTNVLPTLMSYEHPVSMPDWFVPETYYYLWDGERLVGEFRIRHYLTEALRNGAGHIGYSIRKDARGRGYGTAGLRLTIEIARRIIPEDEIYLRVLKDNIASQKVMLNNGAYAAGEDERHFFFRIPGRSRDIPVSQDRTTAGLKK